MYVTADEVRVVVTRSAFRQANTTGALPDEAIEAAIEEAQAGVDAKLRTRYTLPLAEPVPALVKSVTRDIAAFLATLTYRQEKDIPDGDPIIRRYERAKLQLCKIVEGIVDLDGGDGGESMPRTHGGMGRPIQPRAESALFTAGNFGLTATDSVWW